MCVFVIDGFSDREVASLAMARLCAYYSLCPLIDQRSLLGVAEDSTSGCVIVTLGKNIVIRYKVRFTIVVTYFK